MNHTSGTCLTIEILLTSLTNYCFLNDFRDLNAWLADWPTWLVL
jgi:hypothetical protein